ncbi:MAG: SGNH/GDSL hydrolase family protein, partial [Saprospiraceae bacterium]|nr:SGNH/GDSL hydrolase family protein [Saprospiraceae bacterium]
MWELTKRQFMNPCLPIVILISLLSLSINAQEDCLKNQAFKVVVLGSSTAAGSGASRPDSAWVNRYRKYMQSLNPANEVINLAQGGYNSYRLMPTDYTPPAGRPAPDPARNITQAIARGPDAIIVNLPSNDVAAGYGIEQLANFDTMVGRATRAGIPIWITTTQPRNFTNQLQIQLQLLVRDSILIKYGDFAIDFWSPVVDANNWIYPYFSAGDGVHLNDNGHRVLNKKVIESRIPYYLVNSNLPTDYTVENIWPTDEILCHDRPHSFAIEITNLGAASNAPLNLELVSNINGYGDGGRPLMFQNTVSGLGACVSDTITMTFEANNLHNQLQVSLTSADDTIPNNNSLVYDYSVYPAPQIFPQGKRPICYIDIPTLIAKAKDAETILW